MNRIGWLSPVLGMLLLISELPADAGDVPKAKANQSLIPENLARGKPATASASESDDHGPGTGNDGNPETRWCAADNESGCWWQVDLGQARGPDRLPDHLGGRGARIATRSRARPTARAGRCSPTRPRAGAPTRSETHQFNARGIRHVRLTTTGLEAGHWASFFEFEVHGTKMVEPPAAPSRSGRRRKGRPARSS